MAWLGVSYVKLRHECRECQQKGTGLTGIVPKCMGVEVHHGSVHKFYHPKCFFESSKCSDVLEKLDYETAEGMNGYKQLSYSDQMLIHWLFALASPSDGESDTEEQERKKKTKERKRKVVEEKEEKEEEAEMPEKSPTPKKIPSKKRRVQKAVEAEPEEEEDTVEEPKKSSRAKKTAQKKESKKSASPSISSTKTKSSESIIEAPKEEKKPVRRGLREKKNDAEEKEEEDTVAPLAKDKPSEQMVALFKKLFKRNIDEEEAEMGLEDSEDE